MKTIECVWDANAILGESPLYDPRLNTLLWVDIKSEELFTYEIHTGQKRAWSVQGQLSALGLRDEGGYVAATRDGFHVLDLAPDPVFTPIHNPESDCDGNRFNDGKTDPFGGFWAGTMDDAEKDSTAGSWWRVSSKGTLTLMDSGFHVTNGPAFDVDREFVYFTDSARQTIFKANYRSENVIENKAVFKQFIAADGYPDGMTVDRFGNLWVAFWDGCCLRQISPGGRILQKIEMPIPRPTSVAIAGDTLYVTSASVGLTDAQLEESPLSGGLFKIQLNQSIDIKPFFFRS